MFRWPVVGYVLCPEICSTGSPPCSPSVFTVGPGDISAVRHGDAAPRRRAARSASAWRRASSRCGVAWNDSTGRVRTVAPRGRPYERRPLRADSGRRRASERSSRIGGSVRSRLPWPRGTGHSPRARRTSPVLRFRAAQLPHTAATDRGDQRNQQPGERSHQPTSRPRQTRPRLTDEQINRLLGQRSRHGVAVTQPRASVRRTPATRDPSARPGPTPHEALRAHPLLGAVRERLVLPDRHLAA